MIQASFAIMTIAASLSLVAAPAVLAQEAAPQSTEQPVQPAPTYSETELKSFAVAVIEVQRINNAYVPRFDAAGTNEEKQQVVDEAKHEVVKVILMQGISMDRFQQILAHTQADEGLADRVRELIRETR